MNVKKEMRINEVAFVEELLSSTTLRTDNTEKEEYIISPYAAVKRFVRYYYSLGCDLDETTKRIIEKMKDYELDVICYEEYIAAGLIKKYYKALENCKLKLLRNTNTLALYQSEFDRIMQCNTDKEKKILFTMYMLAKYADSYGWVYQTQNEICKLANVSSASMAKEKIFYNLYKHGQYTMTKQIDDTKMHVELSDGIDDEIVLEIDKMEYLGNKFMAYLKPDYVVCECCGKLIKKKNKRGRSPKYCKTCAYNIKLKQNKSYYSEK